MSARPGPCPALTFPCLSASLARNVLCWSAASGTACTRRWSSDAPFLWIRCTGRCGPVWQWPPRTVRCLHPSASGSGGGDLLAPACDPCASTIVTATDTVAVSASRWVTGRKSRWSSVPDAAARTVARLSSRRRWPFPRVQSHLAASVRPLQKRCFSLLPCRRLGRWPFPRVQSHLTASVRRGASPSCHADVRVCRPGSSSHERDEGLSVASIGLRSHSIHVHSFDQMSTVAVTI